MANIFLNSNETFNVGANSTAAVFGQAGGKEDIIVTAGSVITADQNIERIELSGASTSYTYEVSGNIVKVKSGTTVVASIGTGNGSQTIAFSDGSATLNLTALNTATLGGQSIPTTSSALTNLTLNAADKSASAVVTALNVTLAANASLVATSAADTFKLVPATSSYDVSISGFNYVNDKILIPTGANKPSSTANNAVNNVMDSNIDLTWSNSGNLVTIHLTGLDATTELAMQANAVSAQVFGTY